MAPTERLGVGAADQGHLDLHQHFAASWPRHGHLGHAHGTGRVAERLAHPGLTAKQTDWPPRTQPKP